MDRASEGQGSSSDLGVVRDASVENNQFSCLCGDLGGAVDELGIGVGLQEDKGHLVLNDLRSGVVATAVAIDVRFGVARDLGDGDGTRVLALLLGGHRRAGHIMDAAGDGRVEDGGAVAFVGSVADSLVSSFLVKDGVDIDIGGSEVFNLFQVQKVGIRLDRVGKVFSPRRKSARAAGRRHVLAMSFMIVDLAGGCAVDTWIHDISG